MMQPEVTAALVAAAGSFIVSLVSTRAANGAQATLLEVKRELLEFKETFVERLNGRYIRKPDLEEDYPVTRREHSAARVEADKEHARFEREIQVLQERVTTNRARGVGQG